MQHTFSELVDIKSLERIMASFFAVTGISAAILGEDCLILSQIGWQPLCTRFHRCHADTALACQQSDAALLDKIRTGTAPLFQRCRNGLMNVAAPVRLQDRQIAAVFHGQFFLEPPDLAWFRQQARRYGFPEEEYLAAVAQVPVVPQQRLDAIVHFSLQLVSIISELGLSRLQYLDLQKVSNLDGLTGIANRRHFDSCFTYEWARSSRQRQFLTLILADVDLFKAYNDTYGHLAGDDCLKRIARTLQQEVHRGSDLTARYGGEEFAVLLPDTDLYGGMKVAERLRRHISQLQLEHRHLADGVVTASFGVATVLPSHMEDPATLLGAADAMLYKAKEEGRNCIRFTAI